ncbi:MaoC family dehydratase N-terminal domain-containing protein [Ferrovibrio sp.]|uniref:MaoC family dehydratase N-terminal domain-containing protein n=1 Tax=Ferrovibrio sp. TaxID=1917215 RepID=UPI003D0BE15C
MVDRSKAGYTLPPLYYEVEKGQLRFFSKVIGETDPIYFDEAAAKAAGYRSILAPPTFCFSCLRGSADEMPYVTALGMSDDELGRSLHGEQSFEFHEPVCAGDKLTITEKIVDIFEKKSGSLLFILTETRLVNQLEQLAARMQASLIIKAEPAA